MLVCEEDELQFMTTQAYRSDMCLRVRRQKLGGGGGWLGGVAFPEREAEVGA